MAPQSQSQSQLVRRIEQADDEVSEAAVCSMTADCELGSLMASWPAFTTLSLSAPSSHIVHIELCGGKANTMTRAFWDEMLTACQLLTDHSSAIRVVLLTGRGGIFSAGLDLVDHASLLTPPPTSQSVDTARLALSKQSTIRHYQRAFSAVESLPQPVLSLVHGVAVGGAVDLLTAACVRLATTSASIAVKEVDIGLAADVGTLQRISHCIGSSTVVRDWCYTGRTVAADEAARAGFFSQPLCADKEDGWRRLLQLGQLIAGKSPIAVLGTKRALLYARSVCAHVTSGFSPLSSHPRAHRSSTASTVRCRLIH